MEREGATEIFVDGQDGKTLLVMLDANRVFERIKILHGATRIFHKIANTFERDTRSATTIGLLFLKIGKFSDYSCWNNDVRCGQIYGGFFGDKILVVWNNIDIINDDIGIQDVPGLITHANPPC